MSFNDLLKKISRIVNPEPIAAGLEITDSTLRLVVIKDGKTDFFSVKLPPEIVVSGQIRDEAGFSQYLKILKEKASPKTGKNIYAVINIADSNVYTEIFAIPKTADKEIDEAVSLNLQMISPIDFSEAYSDWQIVGEKLENNSSQYDIFGAFIQKNVADKIEGLLAKEGFEVMAIEFSSLALIRALSRFVGNFSPQKNYLIFKLGAEGLSFSIVKGGSLHFLHAVSWKAIYGDKRSIDAQSLRKVIIEEAQRVLSFYEARWAGGIDGIFVVSPAFSEEVFKIISETYADLHPEMPALGQFNDLPQAWFSVLGSAIRGFMPRHQDTIISLASVGTEKKYKNYKTESFVRIWRNIVLSFFAVYFFVAGITDIYMSSRLSSLEENERNMAIRPEMAKISQLQNEATGFNRKISALLRARDLGNNWSIGIGNILDIAGNDVSISRLAMQPSRNGNKNSATVAISGRSANEDAIIGLKKKIEGDKRFSNIEFQVSSINPLPEGGFGFNMAFDVRTIKENEIAD